MICQELRTWYDGIAYRLTYRVDSNTRCKIQIFLAMCIPHPDTLSMGEDNVWSDVGLQHIPAEQGMALQSWTRKHALSQQAVLSSLFLSFNDVFCKSSRVLDIQIGSDSIGS